MRGGGQGPCDQERGYFAKVKDTAARLGIAERVRFLGWHRDMAKVKILAAADFYCQPNIDPESFGITFIEALAAGLPVVTTAMSGPHEIVDDSCGILVSPGEPAAVADALRRLVSDPVLRQNLGTGGPLRARQLCDPEAQMSRLYTVLSRVAR